MGDIIVRNLYKAYGDLQVFQGFNCRFKEKRFNLIVGPSGRGKTSLLNILMGLEEADKGSIEGYKSVSPVFQENRLLEDFSIYENLAYVLDPDNFDIDQINLALARIGLEGKGEEKIRNLSGGMKRRVEILKGVLKESDIYIFDEPFKEMDQDTYIRVMDFVKEELEDETVIFTTHCLSEKEYFNGNIIYI